MVSRDLIVQPICLHTEHMLCPCELAQGQSVSAAASANWLALESISLLSLWSALQRICLELLTCDQNDGLPHHKHLADVAILG